MGVVEALTCFGVCLCSVLWLHLCSNHVIFSNNNTLLFSKGYAVQMMSLSRTDYQICIMIGKDWGGKSHKPETGKLTVASGWAQVCDEVLGTPCDFRVLENSWHVEGR